jgi:glycosyltransferase involved in cell wall biosynthesis
MFESTRLPQPSLWVDELNACDAVLSPSSFVTALFREHGVDVPIWTVPLGVLDDFEFQPRPERETFIFLALADRGIRKGWDIAAKAFVRAFGDDPHYRLVIKHRPRESVFNVVNPNISMWASEMEAKGLSWLYGLTDCLVFPARGEGFGLPPRDYAATGGLVLATNWSGLADYIQEYAEPINAYTMVPAWPGHHLFDGRCGEWAEADVDALADLMRHVVTMPAEERNRIGWQRARATVARCSWDTWADAVLRVYRGEMTQGAEAELSLQSDKVEVGDNAGG